MAMQSVAAAGLLNHLERSQQGVGEHPDLGKLCYENGKVIDVAPADALAQWGIMQVFIGNRTVLESIAKADFIPQPGLSEVTNYWLTLALFYRSRW